MSRREIRRMLMEPRQRLLDRPWVVPFLMALVLVAGVGLGVTVGLSVVSSRKASPPEQVTPMVTRPTAPETTEPAPPPETSMTPPPPAPQSTPQTPEPPSAPAFPVPPPKPGGPADDPMWEDKPLPSAEEPPAQAAAEPSPPVLPAPDHPPDLVPQQAAEIPAWQRFAVPSPATGNRPVIAVVIDDMGVDRRRAERMLQLEAPLTLSWMTYAEDLPHLTRMAREKGHELMVHMPMQPRSDSMNAGPNVLEVGMAPEELRRRITWGLDRFTGYVGVNNHMGSRFTADRAGMAVVIQEIKRRGLFYLDSVTTEKSVIPELARAQNIPFVARHVFIDNEQSVALVLSQLSKAETYARKHGAAIAIGHPHDTTIEALIRWLPRLNDKGLALVPLSTIVKRGNAVTALPPQDIKED